MKWLIIISLVMLLLLAGCNKENADSGKTTIPVELIMCSDGSKVLNHEDCKVEPEPSAEGVFDELEEVSAGQESSISVSRARSIFEEKVGNYQIKSVTVVTKQDVEYYEIVYWDDVNQVTGLKFIDMQGGLFNQVLAG